MDREQAYSLAAAITGLDRYDASKILEAAGLSIAAAAAVVHAHLGVVSHRVQGHQRELALWIFEHNKGVR